MRIVILLIALFSYCNSFSQLLANHGLVFSNQALPLDFDNRQTFPATSPSFWQSHDRFPNFPTEPGMYYVPETKETVTSTCKPWTSFFQSYGGLLRYSAIYGHYPAFIDIGEKQNDIDRHLTPSLMVGTDFFHMIQEDSHIGNIDHFKVSKDFSKSVKANTVTGLFARLQPRRTGVDEFVVVAQQNDSHVYTIEFDGTSFGTPFELITSSRRAYPCIPYGQEVDKDGWHYLPIAVTSSDESFYTVKILLKTKDFVTFYNKPETHSFTGNISLASLMVNADNWVYIGNYSTGTDQLYLVTSCIDNHGNFFDITIINGSNTITTTYWNGSAWAQNNFTPTETIADLSVVSRPDPSAILYCFKRHESLYAFIRVVDGSYYKFHCFESTDYGATWINHGDLTPGVNKDIYRCAGPININEIPTNTNFPIYSSEYVFDNDGGKQAEFYLVEAAFGEISATMPLTYTDKYNYIKDFPDALFGFESDSVTTSGSNITGLIDKTLNGNAPTLVGTPQLTSGHIVNNGTSNGFALNGLAATLAGHSEFTMFFYGQSSSANGGFLTLSKSSDNNVYGIVGLRNNATDDRKFIFNYRVSSGGGDIMQTGFDPALSGNNLITVQCDGRGVRWWINGREQNKKYITGGLLEHIGKWGTGLSAPNRVGIGVLQRGSNAFYQLTWDALVYVPRAYTTEERMKAENYFADKYSITLDRF